MPVARFGLILNLLVPLAFLVSDAFSGKLGADPVKEAIHTTGLVAVTYLLLSLCVTPLKMVTGWGWLIQFRRSPRRFRVLLRLRPPRDLLLVGT